MHSSFDRAMRCYLFAQMQQKGYSLLSRSLCSVYLFSTFSKYHGLHPRSIKLNPFGIRFNIPVHLPINLQILPLPRREYEGEASTNHSNASVNLHPFLSIHPSLYSLGWGLLFLPLLTDPLICLHGYIQVSFYVAARMCFHFGL